VLLVAREDLIVMAELEAAITPAMPSLVHVVSATSLREQPRRSA